MNHPDYNSPTELKNFLEQNNMAMQKKFGQNFMINQTARIKIVDYLELKKDEFVWEIGPGLGCMTEEVLNHGAKINTFEIDRGFISLLKQFFEEQNASGMFSIVEGDVLKTWKNKYFEQSVKPTKLMGNLPYNIAATFIADTITENVVFDKCVFTVQKEVAQRMAAKPSTENYSAFSVLCQWGYDVKLGIVLGSSSFWPRPTISSQAVIMTKKEKPFDGNSKLFVKVVHSLFSARRKTILNNIKPLLFNGIKPEDFFEKCNLDKSLRAENLTLDDFIKITDVLSQLK